MTLTILPPADPRAVDPRAVDRRTSGDACTAAPLAATTTATTSATEALADGLKLKSMSFSTAEGLAEILNSLPYSSRVHIEGNMHMILCPSVSVSCGGAYFDKGGTTMVQNGIELTVFRPGWLPPHISCGDEDEYNQDDVSSYECVWGASRMAQTVTDLLAHDEFDAAMPGLFSARKPGGGGDGGAEFAVSFAPKAGLTGPTDSDDDEPVSKRLKASLSSTTPLMEVARYDAARYDADQEAHVEPAPMQSRSTAAKCGGPPPLPLEPPVRTLSEAEAAVEAVLSTVGAGEVDWRAIDGLQLWEPDRGLSDLAAALKNGACEAIDSLTPERWGGCWAHIWRAVRTNRGKLKDSSTARVDMLYTDLCFLHEVPYEPLLAQLARPAGLNPTDPNPNQVSSL